MSEEGYVIMSCASFSDCLWLTITFISMCMHYTSFALELENMGCGSK